MLKRWLAQIYLGCFFLTGLLVSADLYNRYLKTGSALDLLLMGVAILVLFLGAGSLIYTLYHPSEFRAWISHRMEQSWNRWVLLVLALLVVETGQDVLFLRAELRTDLYIRYQTALGDNYSLLLGVLFTALVGLILLGTAKIAGWIQGRAGLAISFRDWLPFGVLLSVFLFVLGTGYGYQANSGQWEYFQTAAVPLIGVQVGLLLLGFFTLRKSAHWLSARFPVLREIAGRDWLWVVLVWAAAFTLWRGVHIEPNYHIDSPRPPNQEMYLLSDSLEYEIESASFLAGKGFSDYVEHPMYVFFHALLHIFAGDRVLSVIRLQVLVLSLIPGLLYLLTKMLHSRFSGLVVAGLYILREQNQLLLMEHVSGTTVNMVMTEKVAALGLILFFILCAAWLQSPERGILLPLLAGGVLGVLVLVRIELMVLVPVYAVLVIFFAGSHHLYWTRWMAAFFGGLLLALSPWVARNVQRTGTVYIDKYYVIRNLFDVEELFQPQPGSGSGRIQGGEPLSRYSPRQAGAGLQAPVPARTGALQRIRPAIQTGTGAEIMYFHHWANDVKQLLLTLPAGHQPLLTVGNLLDFDPAGRRLVAAKDGFFSEPYLRRYVLGYPYFWTDWDGSIVPRSIVPVLFSLFILSLAYRKMRSGTPAGTRFLALSLLIYITGYAVFGSSGGRFIQVVDWIPLLFYGVGGILLVSHVFDLDLRLESGKEASFDTEDPAAPYSWRRVVLAGVLVFGVGSALPLAEHFIPDQYPGSERDRILAEITREAEKEGNGAAEDVGHALRTADVTAYGKAIFPRYFQAGERMMDDRLGTTPDARFARLEFYLVGTEKIWVAVPMQAPVRLPHGSRVLIVGERVSSQRTDDIRYGEYLKADAVFILGEEGASGTRGKLLQP